MAEFLRNNNFIFTYASVESQKKHIAHLKFKISIKHLSNEPSDFQHVRCVAA